MAGLLDGMDKQTAIGLIMAGNGMMNSNPRAGLLGSLGGGLQGFAQGLLSQQQQEKEDARQAQQDARQARLDDSNLALQQAQAQHYMNGGGSSDGYHQPIQTAQGWAKYNPNTREYELINLNDKPALPVTADPMLAGEMQRAKEGEKVGNVTLGDGSVVPMQHKASVPTLQQVPQQPILSLPVDKSKEWAQSVLPSIIRVESGGNPNAVSSKGAVGLTQIMPATGVNPGYGIAPLQNQSPEEQKRFAVDYLSAAYQHFNGDEAKAISSYNQGIGATDKHGITNQSYVNQVLVRGGDKIIDASNPVTQATIQGAQAIAPQIAQHIGQSSAAKKSIEVAGNVAQKTAELQIESQQKKLDQAAKEVKSSGRAIDLIKQASEKIPLATGSGMGNMVDSAAGFFGIDTKGSTEAAALKSIGANLTASMPRMEGPQSDADRKYYEQMAGSIGDPLVSPAKKKAMLAEIMKIQQRYQQQDVPQQQSQPQQQNRQPPHIDDLVGKYL